MRMLERAGLVPTLRFSTPGRLRPPGGHSGPPRRSGAPGEAPPARHQRLPAQGRRHPELPLGPVEPARPGLLRRPHRVVRRRRRRLRRRAGRAGRPHRARARADPLLPDARRAGRRARCVRGSTRSTWSCSIPRSRSASSGRASASPTASILHGAEVTVPGRLPGSRAALARVLRGAAARRVGRPLPGRRGPPGRARTSRRRWSRSRPASTPAPSSRSRRPSAARRGPGSGLPAPGPLLVSVSRLVPRKGMDVLIEAAEPPGPLLSRPRGGHRRRRAGAGPPAAAGRAEPGAACGCSAG